jgi:hypothetical protein
MADMRNANRPARIINGIDDTAVANPNSISIVNGLELPHSGRAWFTTQFIDVLTNSATYFRWKRTNLLGGS